MTEKSKIVWRELLEWVQAIVLALLVATIIRMFVFTLVQVDGISMEPTLQNRDRLFVHKLLYEPQPGDIVVFDPTGNRESKYIKRVIAVAGQEVFIDFEANSLYVDGELVDEPYIKEHMLPGSNGRTTFGPITVPENNIFVLGDNRNNSHDSRAIGVIDTSRVEGRAVLRFFPFNSFGLLR